jgi:hypothetical protein
MGLTSGAGAAIVTAANASNVYATSCQACHGAAPTFTSAVGYKFTAGNSAVGTRTAFLDGTMPAALANGWATADFNAMATWVAGQRVQAATLLPEFALSDSVGVALSNNAALNLSAVAGASQQAVLTVRNPGGAGLTVGAVATGSGVSVSGCTTAVAANGQCSLTVSFSPAAGSAAGSVGGSVVITTNTGPVDANAVPAAVVRSEVTTLAVNGSVQALSPTIGFSASPGTAGNFGTANSGDAPAPQVITLTNSGTGPVSNLQYALGAGPFAVDAATTTCTAGTVLSNVAGSNQCNIGLKFLPSTPGVVSDSLVVKDGATSLSSLSLSGTVTRPAITISPASLTAFKSIATVLAAQPQTVTVTNIGDGALTLAQLAAPAGYTLSSDNCSGQTLGPNAQCQVGLTLPATTVAGSVAATALQIDEAAHANAAVPILSGSVVVPAGNVLPANALNLAWSDASGAAIAAPVAAAGAAVTVGTAVTLTVKLSNSNGASIGSLPAGAVSIVESGSDFQVTGTSCVGNTCTVSLSFAPTAAGARTATLRVTDAASLTPADITLTGTGAAAPAPASSGGGCTIGGGNAADPLWLLMLAGAGVALLRRRRNISV